MKSASGGVAIMALSGSDGDQQHLARFSMLYDLAPMLRSSAPWMVDRAVTLRESMRHYRHESFPEIERSGRPNVVRNSSVKVRAEMSMTPGRR